MCLLKSPGLWMVSKSFRTVLPSGVSCCASDAMHPMIEAVSASERGVFVSERSVSAGEGAAFLSVLLGNAACSSERFKPSGRRLACTRTRRALTTAFCRLTSLNSFRSSSVTSSFKVWRSVADSKIGNSRMGYKWVCGLVNCWQKSRKALAFLATGGRHCCVNRSTRR